MQPESTYVGTAAPQAAASSQPAVSAAPGHEDIARRAYAIYVQKGRQPGQCQQNWRQAEKDLRQQGQATCAAQGCGCEKEPAAEAGAASAVKTVAGALRSIMGGNGSNRGGASCAPQARRGRKA